VPTCNAGVAAVLAARSDEAPGEVLAHWVRAGNLLEEARWSVATARHAERVFAWREASASWRQVWNLWDMLPAGERAGTTLSDVAVGCVVAAHLADDDTTFFRLVEAALADAEVAADDHATGQILSLYGFRFVDIDVAAGVAALERAVTHFDRTGQPSAEQARALLRLVKVKTFSNATTGTEEAELIRAEAIAEQVGASEVLLDLAAHRGSTRLDAGQVEEGLAELTSATRKAAELSIDSDEPWASLNLTDGYLWLLRVDEAIEAGRRGIEEALARGYRDAWEFALLVTNTVEGLLRQGNHVSAEELVASYLLPDVTPNGWPMHLARAELDLIAGDHMQVLTRVAEVGALGYHNDQMRIWLTEVGAEAEIWEGDPWSAWTRTQQVGTLVWASSHAWRASRMLALAARAAADLVEAHPEADHGGLTKQLRADAESIGCFAPHPARVLGTAHGATFDAELARVQRTGEVSAWLKAKDTWCSHGVPHQAAYAGWRLAEQLLAVGRRSSAAEELAAAYIAADGHVPLRGAIEGLARRARLSLPASQPSPPPVEAVLSGGARYGLTARELDVLRLLGAGATNAEIGRRLYMSPKTASVHVSAIIRKLGVSGRVQAATVADRMGLLPPDGPGQPRP
jgi:DNA-binding CsgD family transcriptional regulator